MVLPCSGFLATDNRNFHESVFVFTRLIRGFGQIALIGNQLKICFRSIFEYHGLYLVNVFWTKLPNNY